MFTTTVKSAVIVKRNLKKLKSLGLYEKICYNYNERSKHAEDSFDSATDSSSDESVADGDGNWNCEIEKRKT